tara:strand:- start:205 stop:939 length:735 start_codon:yes stop_codon:yes gene_type:complete
VDALYACQGKIQPAADSYSNQTNSRDADLPASQAAQYDFQSVPPEDRLVVVDWPKQCAAALKQVSQVGDGGYGIDVAAVAGALSQFLKGTSQLLVVMSAEANSPRTQRECEKAEKQYSVTRGDILDYLRYIKANATHPNRTECARATEKAVNSIQATLDHLNALYKALITPDRSEVGGASSLSSRPQSNHSSKASQQTPLPPASSSSSSYSSSSPRAKGASSESSKSEGEGKEGRLVVDQFFLK